MHSPQQSTGRSIFLQANAPELMPANTLSPQKNPPVEPPDNHEAVFSRTTEAATNYAHQAEPIKATRSVKVIVSEELSAFVEKIKWLFTACFGRPKRVSRTDLSSQKLSVEGLVLLDPPPHPPSSSPDATPPLSQPPTNFVAPCTLSDEEKNLELARIWSAKAEIRDFSSKKQACSLRLEENRKEKSGLEDNYQPLFNEKELIEKQKTEIKKLIVEENKIDGQQTIATEWLESAFTNATSELEAQRNAQPVLSLTSEESELKKCEKSRMSIPRKGSNGTIKETEKEIYVHKDYTRCNRVVEERKVECEKSDKKFKDIQRIKDKLDKDSVREALKIMYEDEFEEFCQSLDKNPEEAYKKFILSQFGVQDREGESLKNSYSAYKKADEEYKEIEGELKDIDSSNELDSAKKVLIGEVNGRLKRAYTKRQEARTGFIENESLKNQFPYFCLRTDALNLALTINDLKTSKNPGGPHYENIIKVIGVLKDDIAIPKREEFQAGSEKAAKKLRKELGLPDAPEKIEDAATGVISAYKVNLDNYNAVKFAPLYAKIKMNAYSEYNKEAKNDLDSATQTRDTLIGLGSDLADKEAKHLEELDEHKAQLGQLEAKAIAIRGYSDAFKKQLGAKEKMYLDEKFQDDLDLTSIDGKNAVQVLLKQKLLEDQLPTNMQGLIDKYLEYNHITLEDGETQPATIEDANKLILNRRLAELKTAKDTLINIYTENDLVRKFGATHNYLSKETQEVVDRVNELTDKADKSNEALDPLCILHGVDLVCEMAKETENKLKHDEQVGGIDEEQKKLVQMLSRIDKCISKNQAVINSAMAKLGSEIT